MLRARLAKTAPITLQYLPTFASVRKFMLIGLPNDSYGKNGKLLSRRSGMTEKETEAASNSKRTVTMTFRIDERVMDILKTESEKKEVSLNIMVNQILRRYVDWQMYEPKVGMISIARPVASALFESMNEAEITKMAREVGKNAVHDIALFMKGRMDLSSFMSWFESRMKSSSIEFSHTRLPNGKHSYVMKHDLGYNWSLYHKTLLELIFNETLQRRADIATTATTMTLSFEE